MLTKYCGEITVLIPNDIPLEMADAYEYEWKHNGFTFSNSYYGYFALYRKPQVYKFKLYLKDKKTGLISVQEHCIETIVKSSAYIIPDAPIKPRHGLYFCKIQRYMPNNVWYPWGIVENNIESFDKMLDGLDASPIEDLKSYHIYEPSVYNVIDLFKLSVPNNRYTFFFLSAIGYDFTKPFTIKLYLHPNQSFSPYTENFNSKNVDQVFSQEPLSILLTIQSSGIANKWTLIPGMPYSQYGRTCFWIKDSNNAYMRYYNSNESYAYGDRNDVICRYLNPIRFEPVPRHESCNVIFMLNFSDSLKASKRILGIEITQDEKTSKALSILTHKLPAM